MAKKYRFIRRNKTFLSLLIFILGVTPVGARKIHHKHYKFEILIPDRMIEVQDSNATAGSAMYYDSVTRIVLMISERESKFRSVNEYMDCSREGLEKLLKYYYEDSTLSLISCNKSVYYPEQTTIIHFKVTNSPGGLNTYMIYFIHHRNKDIQISFAYRYEAEEASQKYIDVAMRSLRLK